MNKSLPYNEEVEQAALGASLLDRQALLHMFEHVDEADWYVEAHRAIYVEMRRLHRAGKPVDLIHLKPVVSERHLPTLLELFDCIPHSGGIKSYCDTIVDLSTRRRAIGVLQAGLTGLYDLEQKDPITSAQNSLLALGKRRGNEALEMAALVETSFGRAWDAHQRARNGEVINASHVQTGVIPLDEMLTIKRGDMVIVGARPSAGKTSIGLQMACHIASEKPVLFFSLEEPAQQIADRYLTTMTGIPMRRMQEGRTSTDELDKLADAQASAVYCRLVVNDTPALRVSDMRSIAMRLQSQRNEEWGAIMIDHMIKVRPEDGKSVGHQRLTQVSQDLKNLARIMQIPVIVLTQLRRPQDEEAEPRMSDLRESGSIEEDADSILLIHRPERDKSFSMAKFLLTKQRTGPCGSFELCFDAEKMRFKQLKGFGTL